MELPIPGVELKHFIAMLLKRLFQFALCTPSSLRLLSVLDFLCARCRFITGPEKAPTIALLNMRVKPFDDVRARRAVGGYGLDRVEIAKVAFQGRARPLVSVVPPGVPDAIDLNEMYPYRPDEAKRLLKDLGFDEKNPLRFTILVPNQDATMADVAALIKNQMAKIGVEAKINLMDTTAAVERVLVKHDFDMHISSFANLRDINQRSVSFFKARSSTERSVASSVSIS